LNFEGPVKLFIFSKEYLLTRFINIHSFAMGKKIKEIDDYIAKSAPFARPILKKLREMVHQVCPETEEKMKWSFPHFDYKNEMMCHMAAFKQHCAFGFGKPP
jgi:hypothetical protein